MSSAALDVFRRSLVQIDYTRARMEQLYGDGRISQRDLHAVYEALFLRVVTSFEVFLEQLFMSILDGKVKYTSAKRVSVRMTASSKRSLTDIVLQGDNYLNWLPFGYTEGRAKIYLNGGRPFSDVTDGDKSLIKTVTIIRNAISHKSSHASREFERAVIGSQLLLRGEKKPAGYLRSQIRANPNQNRFQVYVNRLFQIATDLS